MSAYGGGRWVMQGPLGVTFKPGHSFFLTVNSKMRSQLSGQRGTGRSGLLNATLFEVRMGVGEPFMSMETTTDSTQVSIHEIHLEGNPFFSRVQSSNSYETLSDALWKSNLSMTALIFLCLYESITSTAMRPPLMICLLFIKDDWDVLTRSS